MTKETFDKWLGKYKQNRTELKGVLVDYIDGGEYMALEYAVNTMNRRYSGFCVTMSKKIYAEYEAKNYSSVLARNWSDMKAYIAAIPDMIQDCATG